MRIDSAEYVKSFTGMDTIDLPEKPAIAFIGRSNVGKSSLINHLLNRKKLVKTSSTPGKTQLINYFLINESFYFVDLPGYGYAKVPEQVRKSWSHMISDFVSRMTGLKMVVLIVDARHNPSKEDAAFYQLLTSGNIPHMVIANKVDKLKQSEQSKSKKRIQKTLELEKPPLFHSALKRVGHDEIWNVLSQAITT